MNDFYLEQLRALGPDVTVVRTLMDGDVVYETLPAVVAVDSVLYDERNGVLFRSARILWGRWLDVFSSSGSGLASYRAIE